MQYGNIFFELCGFISTASGALVVGGVSDIYTTYTYISGYRFECSKLFNGEDQTSLWPSLAVCGSLWQPVTVCGSLWQSLAVCGCMWPYVAVCGSLWQSVAVCGSLWQSVTVCGSL